MLRQDVFLLNKNGLEFAHYVRKLLVRQGNNFNEYLTYFYLLFKSHIYTG